MRKILACLTIGVACAAPRDLPPVDSTPVAPTVAADTVIERPDSVAARVVAALKARDIPALADLTHPARGIRFTPYTHVDTAADQRLAREELLARWERPDSLLWGSYDGSGEPMRLSMRQYFDRFVHDFDVAASPRVARDSAPMGVGNSLYNIREVYPDAAIIEFNTPGTDPRYGGMDWRSLWVVLERTGDRWYLVGLVHGSWTT
ncbi:MAG TPA: hypothetical protein VFO55_03895 [Gemmatimonadaceae bacterium]|nr:hypothetical protein [Gemmatimonadaceae bacterium]